MGKLSGFTQSFKSNGGYLVFGLRTGYIYGYTSYDFNHHTSELEYPFNSYMGGGNLSLGYKDFSINSEVWGSLCDDPSAGYNMKDKDWDSKGNLESDTKSSSNMNAVIWDANLRYDFFKYSFNKKKTDEESQKSANIKLGALVGYRYERFGYKMYGLYQTCGTGSGYGSDQEVLEYKVKFHLPYVGLAMEAGGEKFGVSMNAKYSICPSANDYDNHLLRTLEFSGNYKNNPNVFMADCTMFWKFAKNWQTNLGVDATLIRLNGSVSDATNNPAWHADQSIDTRQFIYWIGLGYRF